MSSAITASVWGQGRAAVALSAQVAQQGLRDGDEECHICRDDIPATIAFVPCKHKVCFGCVENMRAKNIFKADKGIKCPFCRQYVDGYRSLRMPNDAVQKFLLEANKAANIAAQARLVAERKAMGLSAAGPAPAAAAAGGGGSSTAAGGTSSRPQSAGNAGATAAASTASAASSEDQHWNCGSCGNANYMWREFCGKCKRPCPDPYASDKLSQTRKDLAVATREELVSYIREQGAAALRKGLKDMGVTIDSWKTYGGTASVREATALYGLKRRVLHIAELLSEPTALRDVALSHQGNFAVQRVFEAMAKLRQAFPPDRPNKDLQDWTAAHQGRDPFAMLLGALQSNLLEYCLHDKGVYVAQCAAGLASNKELVHFAKVLFPAGLPVSRDPRGVFVLLSTLDLLSQKIWDDAVNCEPALQAVDLLCKQFSASDKQLLHTAMHALSGKVVVRAIAVAMPRPPALKLAVKIASMAASLAAKEGGLSTVTELMQLYGHNQQAAEGLRDVVTTMAYSLQGQINRFAVSCDESAQDMLLCLVERLGHEQEQAWLDSIAQELVGCCDALLDNPYGLELLKFTLSQPCMDLDSVSLHIAEMRTVLGKKALLPIVADVMERMASNPPAAPPKYPAASVIQPELRYYLNAGWRVPLPPPPPPKPGEPGYDEYAAQAAARAEAQAQAAAAARAEKEAAAQARRDAAAAAAAEAVTAAAISDDTRSDVSSGAVSGTATAAVTDPWGTVTALGAAGPSSAWAVNDNSSSSSVTSPSNAAAAVDAVLDSGATANPWSTVLHSPDATAATANAWAVSEELATQSWSTSPAAATAAVAAAPCDPVPLASVAFNVPLAVPVAVPIAEPISVPLAVPVAVPVASTAVPAAVQAAAAPARSALPPRPYQQQQQPQPPRASVANSSSTVAVADFHNAAPAQLQPGSTPAILGSSAAAWPEPQQAVQMEQQQRQHSGSRPNSRPNSAGAARGVQQQQQQVQQPWSCEVCTYEHMGSEAEFLFCAMCSTQKPL